MSNTQSPTLACDMRRTSPQEPCHMGQTFGDFRGDQDSPPLGFGFLSCEAPSICPSAVQVQHFSERPSTGKRSTCQVWPAAHQHAPWSPSFLPQSLHPIGWQMGSQYPIRHVRSGMHRHGETKPPGLPDGEESGRLPGGGADRLWMFGEDFSWRRKGKGARGGRGELEARLAGPGRSLSSWTDLPSVN